MGKASSEGARLLEAALAYADMGWPVLPLVRREKRPLTKRGLLDASVEPAVIRDWWDRWPMANIGLRTGVQFDVLDIDGEVGRASLEAKAGPETAHSGPVSRTGRGEHWLFLPSGTANRAGLLPKLDWRGTNGYIVAPPSIHPDGHRYEWANDHGPLIQLPVVPDWLAPLLVEYKQNQYDRDNIRILVTHPYSKNSPSRNLLLDPFKFEALNTDIVQMAHELGYTPVPDGGGRFAIQCPFHEGDREPSLKLYPRDNSFYCFGCGAWGDALNLRDKRPGGHRA
jgi:hypothetical protein